MVEFKVIKKCDCCGELVGERMICNSYQVDTKSAVESPNKDVVVFKNDDKYIYADIKLTLKDKDGKLYSELCHFCTIKYLRQVADTIEKECLGNQ